MNIKVSSLIKSLIVSYVLTLLILILLSFLLLKLHLSESIISIGITLSYVISCFTGGYIAGRMSSSRRFLSKSLRILSLRRVIRMASLSHV